MSHARYGTGSCLLSLVLTVFFPMTIFAQEDPNGVAGSGMEQGSGAVTTRSDLTMSVESLPGTSAIRLNAIGQAIGTQMTQLRACYIDVLEQRPTVQGDLHVQVRIPEQRGTSIVLEVSRDTLGDQSLTDCLINTVRRAPLGSVRGPSGGLLVMHFQNTAAEGAALVARERARSTPSITMIDGRPRAEARTPSGEVEIIVDGVGDTEGSALSSLHRNIQARIGTMLDCRRRASRRGLDPEGEMVLSLNVPRRGAASGRRISSSIADTTAPQCVLRSLVLSARGQEDAAGSYRITVRFAALQPVGTGAH